MALLTGKRRFLPAALICTSLMLTITHVEPLFMLLLKEGRKNERMVARGRRGVRDSYSSEWPCMTAVFETDNQQGGTVQHRELRASWRWFHLIKMRESLVSMVVESRTPK